MSFRQDVMWDRHSAHFVKWLKIIKIMTVVELFLKKERKEKKAQKSERKWENQMSCRNAGKHVRERFLPPQTKASPRIFFETLSVSDDNATSYIFFCLLLWVSLIYLFHFNKEDTMGKTCVKGCQLGLTLKQAFPQVPHAASLWKYPKTTSSCVAPTLGCTRKRPSSHSAFLHMTPSI